MLRELRIQNFRSCADTRVMFPSSVAALVGRNGVGKTNILRAIELLADCATGPIGGIGERLEIPSDSKLPLSLTSEVELGGTRYRYFVSYAVDPDFRVEEHLTIQAPNESEATLLQRHGFELTSPLWDQVLNLNLFSGSMTLVATVLPPDDPVLAQTRPLRDFLLRSRYYLLEDRSDARDFVTDVQYEQWRKGFVQFGDPSASVALRLLHMAKADRGMLDEFKALLGENGLGLLGDLNVYTSELRETRRDGAAEVTGKAEEHHIFRFIPSRGMGGAGRPLAFAQLSAGTRRIIRMIVSLLFDRRSLMLVEEPEVSIHPGMLRKLIDMFRSYSHDTQVIFTTHSGDVLDMLEPTEIQIVAARDGGTVARPFSQVEADAATRFLKEEGSLSEFVETVDADSP